MTVTKKQVRDQLSEGGQRVFQKAEAEIYDRVGFNDDGSPILERQTGAGMKTKVHQLLDPRLDLSDAQRFIGNYYGALTQEVMSGGGGGTVIREHVDVTRTSGGGVSEARLHKIQMLGAAVEALQAAPSITYAKGKARAGRYQGQHKSIRPFQLAFLVCVNQRTLSHVALTYDWTRAPIEDGKIGRRVVPDRQRKALVGALRNTLDLIEGAWEGNTLGL